MKMEHTKITTMATGSLLHMFQIFLEIYVQVTFWIPLQIVIASIQHMHRGSIYKAPAIKVT